MADFETITVNFTIDRDSLNRALGNTPNVTLRAALEELLEDAFSQKSSHCPNCDHQQPESIRAIWYFQD